LQKNLYLSVLDTLGIVDFPDVLLAGGSNLTNKVEVFSDGVCAVRDDVMLQH